MSNKERREAVRERVKRWKEAHPYSVRKQRARWYAKRKKKVVVDKVTLLPITLASKREVREVQETRVVSMAEVEGWEEREAPRQAPSRMEPKEKGGQQYARFREVVSGVGGAKDGETGEAGGVRAGERGAVESLGGSGRGGEGFSATDEERGGDRPGGVLDSAEDRRARFQRLKREYGGIEVEME